VAFPILERGISAAIWLGGGAGDGFCIGLGFSPGLWYNQYEVGSEDRSNPSTSYYVRDSDAKQLVYPVLLRRAIYTKARFEYRVVLLLKYQGLVGKRYLSGLFNVVLVWASDRYRPLGESSNIRDVFSWYFRIATLQDNSALHRFRHSSEYALSKRSARRVQFIELFFRQQYVIWQLAVADG